jgi:hypothetical protein
MSRLVGVLGWTIGQSWLGLVTLLHPQREADVLASTAVAPPEEEEEEEERSSPV